MAVSDPAFIVPPTVREPLKFESPYTDNRVPGVEVAIPILPVLSMPILTVPPVIRDR